MKSKIVSLLFGVAVAGSAQALSYERPDCVADDIEYFIEQDYSDGLRIAFGRAEENHDVRWFVLGNCSAGSQLKMLLIEHGDTGLDAAAIRDRIVEMIASSKTYTFEDVASEFSTDVAIAEVGPISPDHCICKHKAV